MAARWRAVPYRTVEVLPRVLLMLVLALPGLSCQDIPGSAWERGNPLEAVPEPPLGIRGRLLDVPDPPTPARVRLGRWLFYDARLSADRTVSCGTCHRPDQGFSETRRVSTGVFGGRGTRKSSSIVNLAFAPYPHFFWDGRAASLEEQALGPIENPVEMGIGHVQLVATLEGIPGYRPYFVEAFGDGRITKERVAKAIADYERTRFAGNSAWDRWRSGGDAGAASALLKQGDALFSGKAACNQCHLGDNFADGRFHNLGIGWNDATGTFADEGRAVVTGRDLDRGAFKTPTLRDVSRHAPYMHDGSVRTLREVVELYNRGGTKNPWLSAKIFPLGLTGSEMDALVAFMEALESDLPPEVPPTMFPQ